MTRKLDVGFVPLVDAAPLIAAAEYGFAANEGLLLNLVRQASWASLRDHLNLGHLDCAQALAPLPIASAFGIGQVRADTVVPFWAGAQTSNAALGNAHAKTLKK